MLSDKYEEKRSVAAHQRSWTVSINLDRRKKKEKKRDLEELVELNWLTIGTKSRVLLVR